MPHGTDAIIEWIERVAKIAVDDTKEEPDVCIIELGGTVGDIESMLFVEAMRQLKRKAGKHNFIHIDVSLILMLPGGDLKTKLTQSAHRGIRSAGLAPDLVACRCEKTLDKDTIDKIALYCDVDTNNVIQSTEVDSLYHVPMSVLLPCIPHTCYGSAL